MTVPSPPPGPAQFIADPESIDGSAHRLIEIAGELLEGRLDRDIGTMARKPYVPQDIADKVHKFATFADGQYRDLTALVAALSSKLTETAEAYRSLDERGKKTFDHILESGQYIRPEDR